MMASSAYDFGGIPIMVVYISSPVSVENSSRCGVSFGFGVYLCVPLKNFLILCILFKKNAAKSSAGCWSDVDSGSGLCLFWLVISVTVLYSY